MEEYQPKSMPIFLDQLEAIRCLPNDNDRLDCLEAMCEFYFSIEPVKEEKSAVAKALLSSFKQSLITSKDISKARSANGKKSKRGTKSTMGNDQAQISEKQKNNKEITNDQQKQHKPLLENNDQELEQELEQELVPVAKATATAETTTPPPSENVPYAEIMENYQSLCPRLSRIRGIDGERKKKTSAIFKKLGAETLYQVFQMANESDFLCGLGENGFTADFDWLIKPTNANKVLEGKYDNKEPPPVPTYTGYRASQPQPRGFMALALEMEQENQE